ncbi:16S rRNA (guanine(966)-N(2))-methyltransferase RsmD [Aciduricibacillus chroicocephali]|uniref:16S rRNA (Guanine(966)-N(2))-methyltransferase RsmD n=2 Tax=Aciduricibacillus chroicocephali TaxID=3054939 RepID=A0ABY9KYT2_9BACI|nr:16S rRNA (guanine(966)-N(2))-methyltransferase RsmD [Bacillaceae bacterium 44XB]
MRVIAGEMKGRRLDAVPGSATRPTTDKIKESIFQIMGPYFDGGICLDLFAGSGSLGIEALSRGMDEAIFVDKNPKAVQVIKQNLQTLKIEEHAEVFRADAFRALQAIAKRGLKFKLILLDPPYGKVDYCKLIEVIEASSLLDDGGIIYAEHEPGEKVPESTSTLHITKQTDYSRSIGITIYEKNIRENEVEA